MSRKRCSRWYYIILILLSCLTIFRYLELSIGYQKAIDSLPLPEWCAFNTNVKKVDISTIASNLDITDLWYTLFLYVSTESALINHTFDDRYFNHDLYRDILSSPQNIDDLMTYSNQQIVSRIDQNNTNSTNNSKPLTYHELLLLKRSITSICKLKELECDHQDQLLLTTINNEMDKNHAIYGKNLIYYNIHLSKSAGTTLCRAFRTNGISTSKFNCNLDTYNGAMFMKKNKDKGPISCQKQLYFTRQKGYKFIGRESPMHGNGEYNHPELCDEFIYLLPFRAPIERILSAMQMMYELRGPALNKIAIFPTLTANKDYVKPSKVNKVKRKVGNRTKHKVKKVINKGYNKIHTRLSHGNATNSINNLENASHAIDNFQDALPENIGLFKSMTKQKMMDLKEHAHGRRLLDNNVSVKVDKWEYAKWMQRFENKSLFWKFFIGKKFHHRADWKKNNDFKLLIGYLSNAVLRFIGYEHDINDTKNTYNAMWEDFESMNNASNDIHFYNAIKYMMKCDYVLPFASMTTDDKDDMISLKISESPIWELLRMNIIKHFDLDKNKYFTYWVHHENKTQNRMDFISSLSKDDLYALETVNYYDLKLFQVSKWIAYIDTIT